MQNILNTTVDLKVGFSCNNDCLHCVVTEKRTAKDLSYEQIIGEIEHYLKDHKKINLVLTGGEYTIRPDATKILTALDKYKNEGKLAKIFLQTNGRALVDPLFARRCAQTIDYFLIAVHGHTQALHDHITGQPGSFLETIKGIQNLLDLIRDQVADIEIVTQTVISRINYTSLPAIFKFLNEFVKVKCGNLTFPHPMGSALSKDIVPTYTEIFPYINEAAEYCLKNGFNLNFEQLPLCVFNDFLQEKQRAKILGSCQQSKNKKLLGTDPGAGSQDKRLDYNYLLAQEYRKNSLCTSCPATIDCVGVWKEYPQLYPDKPWQINIPKAISAC